MPYRIYYGSDESQVAVIQADDDVAIFTNSVEKALDGSGSRWVEVPGNEGQCILISPGVPVRVREVSSGSGRVSAV